MSSSIFEYANKAGFPSFADMFEYLPDNEPRMPLYMTLLGAANPSEVQLASRCIAGCLAASPDANSEVVSLFADIDWRPQLVGAMTMLHGRRHGGITKTVTSDTLASLWAAFDQGSWVSPQLAATAYLCDPNFEAAARSRVETGCAIDDHRLAGLDWDVRHSAAGPGSLARHSSKALAALVQLSRKLRSTGEANSWLERAIAVEEIRARLDADREGGDRIAERWLRNIEAFLDEERNAT